MKVYVDIDDTRKITTYHDGLGTQQGLYVYGKDKIEVLSLTDYTKQVRKEVVQEFKEIVRQKYPICYMKMGEQLFNSSESAISLKKVTEILDQIQAGLVEKVEG